MTIKNTKLVIATVALILAVGAIAFAAGVGRGTPTLVVDHASDVLGGSSSHSTEPTTKPTPKPERTTFTTSYPERTAAAAEPKRATQEQPTTRSTRATSAPAATEPTKAPTSSRTESRTPAPSPAPSPSKTPTPLAWLVSQLTSGF